MTLQWAACSTHATLRCVLIKKSATSIDEISLHIYSVLPSASWTEAPHSTPVTPILILSSHHNCPAASDNNTVKSSHFPQAAWLHVTVISLWNLQVCCNVMLWYLVTSCDITKHLLGMLQPNMKALYYCRTSGTTHTLYSTMSQNIWTSNIAAAEPQISQQPVISLTTAQIMKLCSTLFSQLCPSHQIFPSASAVSFFF